MPRRAARIGHEDLPTLWRVDDACVRFERDRQVGGTPRLRDYVGGACGPAERSALLRELIAVDLHYRRLAGEHLAFSDYLHWFPDEQEAVAAAFRCKDTLTATAPRLRDEGWPTIPGIRLSEKLGAGGMGVVYRGEQAQPRRAAAVKVIATRWAEDPQRLERFWREVAILADICHPNVIRLYGAGEAAGAPYYVMEYANGGSLDHLLRRGGLPPVGATALVEALARGAHAAHEKGIVHRDLKPANVLLSMGDAGTGGGWLNGVNITPKIADFGLAKRDDSLTLTMTGQVMGTPSYMAPEQARGERDVGPAADIYAIGAILYHCLSGHPPPQAKELSCGGLRDRLLTPEADGQEVPAELRSLCLRCLSEPPSSRHSSAEELAEELGLCQRQLAPRESASCPRAEPPSAPRLSGCLALIPLGAFGLAAAALALNLFRP